MPNDGDHDRRGVSLANVVVVGASLAGLRAVEMLRREGFDGRLTLVGAEPHLPYDRPPLSKQILRGEWEPERLALRRHPYGELDLDLRLGTRALSLDPGAQRVSLDDGTALDYDGLILATGASPRTIPGTPDLSGIHVLRSLDDALALRADLDRNPARVAVIGAGFIGAEVAASCRERGLRVTMIEPLEAPMIRGLGIEMGGLMAAIHRDQGVDLRLGIGVEAFEGADRVERLRLSDGSVVDCDVVVVGIGVVPETGWLESSGLELDNGVVCDETCATAAKGVVAAGDVARWPNRLFGRTMRVEHWTHAVEQGVAAARRLLVGDAAAEPFAPVPLVWTDQYDLRIQFCGIADFTGASRVVHGSIAERKFVTLFEHAGRLIGALAFNSARLMIQYRGLIAESASFEQALAHARQSEG